MANPILFTIISLEFKLFTWSNEARAGIKMIVTKFPPKKHRSQKHRTHGYKAKYLKLGFLQEIRVYSYCNQLQTQAQFIFCFTTLKIIRRHLFFPSEKMTDILALKSSFLLHAPGYLTLFSLYHFPINQNFLCLLFLSLLI